MPKFRININRSKINNYQVLINVFFTPKSLPFPAAGLHVLPLRESVRLLGGNATWEKEFERWPTELRQGLSRRGCEGPWSGFSETAVKKWRHYPDGSWDGRLTVVGRAYLSSGPRPYWDNLRGYHRSHLLIGLFALGPRARRPCNARLGLVEETSLKEKR